MQLHGMLSSMLVGLLTGALILRSQFIDVLKLVLVFYCVRIFVFTSAAYLNLNPTIFTVTIQLANFASAFAYMILRFGFAWLSPRASFNVSDFALRKIFLSENSIGFLRSFTPIAIFLLFSLIPTIKGNFAACLTYGFIIASICTVTMSSCMLLRFRRVSPNARRTRDRYSSDMG